MELEWDGEAIIQKLELGNGDTLTIHASNMRRERTGFHARIAFLYGTFILDYDTFNVDRREERQRLGNSVHKMLGATAKADYTTEKLNHDLNSFCLVLPTMWEEQRFTLDFYDVDEEPEPLRSVLDPFIIEGGGTIFFGDPGAGKSYTMITMALCIGTGTTKLWKVDARPVLYVNMERSPSSLKRRFTHVARALGVSGANHQVSFLHARGMSFNAIARKVKQFSQIHTGAVGFFDSISRGQQGSLIEDETANKVIDFLNGSFDTWAAIGHTGRSDKSHTYGNTMFDAGEDIGVQLASEKRLPLGMREGSADLDTAPSSELGICLTVKKENDLGYVKPFYFAMTFRNNIVVDIRPAKATEFPNLLLKEAQSDEDKIEEYLLDIGNATATQVAKDLSLERTAVSRLMANSPRFTRVEKQGKEVFYAVAYQRV